MEKENSQSSENDQAENLEQILPINLEKKYSFGKMESVGFKP